MGEWQHVLLLLENVCVVIYLDAQYQNYNFLKVQINSSEGDYLCIFDSCAVCHAVCSMSAGGDEWIEMAVVALRGMGGCPWWGHNQL